jgi:DNA repair protein RecN (Recombination protein N)
MLRRLSIKRLAVVDSVDVEFGPGLNVLTGETGAGKSILIEAVGLLLGGRASADLVRTGEDVATVEAIFERGGEEILVRREITVQGRSRALVNGELATAGTLKELGPRLIELHGQRDHQTLLDPATHVAVLDAFGQLESRVESTKDAFQALLRSGEALSRSRSAASQRAARQELAAFQVAELHAAMLKQGEDQELAATREVLAQAERVQGLCAKAYASLYERDGSVLAELGAVWRHVAELATLDPRFQPYLAARDTIKAQFEDLALFLSRYAERVDASPARLQQVEDRLALLGGLKKKYGPSVADVIAKRDSLEQELAELEAVDERVARLETEFGEARTRYLAFANGLTNARRRAGVEFAAKLERHLAELAMDRTQFEVRFQSAMLPEERWTAAGVDEVEFFISPNPGEEVRPLTRIVSGGELSRIMLAIKTVMISSLLEPSQAGVPSGNPRDDASARPKYPAIRDVPGLVFDEVDAGIGGRVADAVGQRLSGLAADLQVLCITHLPQIAAYADRHFHVAKLVEGSRTSTSVVPLEGEARVKEIGRMLSGSVMTDSVRASALELLERGRGAAHEVPPLGEPKPKGESETSKAKGAFAPSRRRSEREERRAR